MIAIDGTHPDFPTWRRVEAEPPFIVFRRDDGLAISVERKVAVDMDAEVRWRIKSAEAEPTDPDITSGLDGLVGLGGFSAKSTDPSRPLAAELIAVLDKAAQDGANVTISYERQGALESLTATLIQRETEPECAICDDDGWCESYHGNGDVNRRWKCECQR